MGVPQELFWLKVTGASKLHHCDLCSQTYTAKLTLAIIINGKQSILQHTKIVAVRRIC